MPSITLNNVLWAINFSLIGAAVILLCMIHSQPPPRIQIVQVPKIVERRVVVRVPVVLTARDQEQIHCMAENAYYEAADQGDLGIIAVNNVVINRIHSGRFARTPCSVIRQRTQTVCQFSWQCEPRRPIRDRRIFRRTIKLAENVYLGNVSDVTRGATYYHANYVKPQWSYDRSLKRTRQIGMHIFYKMR